MRHSVLKVRKLQALIAFFKLPKKFHEGGIGGGTSGGAMTTSPSEPGSNPEMTFLKCSQSVLAGLSLKNLLSTFQFPIIHIIENFGW